MKLINIKILCGIVSEVDSEVDSCIYDHIWIALRGERSAAMDLWTNIYEHTRES